MTPQIEAFLEMMAVERDASPHTLSAYGRDLADAETWLGDAGGLMSAPQEALEAWFADLSRRGLSAATAARRRASVRQFYRFSLGEGWRADDPSRRLDAPKQGRSLPKTLSRDEIEALLTAAAGRELRVMFPMIATVDEFRAARELVDIECDWARRRGRPLPSLLRVGAMIECPSLLWHLDALLPLTDFVSIGTNDLFQYMYAADRTNPLVSDRYDPLSPPTLRALQTIQKACADTGTPVSICGELAGRPLEAFALITLGYSRLSVPAGGVGPVKRMILSADLNAARRGMNVLLGSSAGSVRGEIESLARKLNVEV